VSYDIELNELELVDDEKVKDNIQEIKETLLKIEEILNDIDARLTEGGL